jgi:hypothetical protein
MCDSEMECTLPRIAGLRTQINTQSLIWEKQITISEKPTEIFAIGATVAPPQVSYGFITNRSLTPLFIITDRLMCTRVIAHFLNFKTLEKLYVTNRLWINS